MSDHDLLYISDISKSLQKIEKCVSGLSDDEFLKNEEKQEVVLFNLQIIGEAAGKLSKELRERHPEVDWKKLKALRNMIVHEYFNITPKFVLYTVRNSMPVTHKQMAAIEKELK